MTRFQSIVNLQIQLQELRINTVMNLVSMVLKKWRFMCKNVNLQLIVSLLMQIVMVYMKEKDFLEISELTLLFISLTKQK
jgi:hypothetical protein